MSRLQVYIKKLEEIFQEWRGNKSCLDGGRPVFDASELLDFAEYCLNHEANDVINWVSVEERLPNELETVWISNGKGWTTLGCLLYAENGWHWAETNGVIYQENGRIVSECESDDLDVKFWHKLPEPPCL